MKNKHIGKLSKVSSEISTSSELIQAESRSGEYEISIICDIGWHIEDLPEYITASDIRGNKGRAVTFTFSPNNSLTEVRSGSFKIVNSAGNYKVIEYIQNSAIIEYEYVFSIKNNSIEFGYEAESKELNIESYKIPSINDIVSGDNIEVSYYASESDWISVENNKIFVTENNSFERSETITITQYESGKTVSVDIHQDQAIIEYKYRIESESNVVNAPAAPSTQHLIINAYCDELLNGNIISTQSVDIRSGNEVYWDSTVSFDFSNNTTENVITSSKTFTPNILSDKPSSYDIPTLVITTKQDAGYKVYSDVETSLSYQSAAPAAGGICSPALSYSQTYTWNGYGDSLSVDQSSFTKSYSLASTTGASINTSTGAITWESNKSTASRTSSNITVTVTGLGGKSKQTTATCQQNAGYYTYGDITISSFSYTAVSAIGGNSSPSIVYSQPYGWNGETSGAAD